MGLRDSGERGEAGLREFCLERVVTNLNLSLEYGLKRDTGARGRGGGRESMLAGPSSDRLRHGGRLLSRRLAKCHASDPREDRWGRTRIHRAEGERLTVQLCSCAQLNKAVSGFSPQCSEHREMTRSAHLAVYGCHTAYCVANKL